MAYKKTKEAIAKLTPEQYRVTQQNGTERPFTGEYNANKEPGIYVDIVSGEPAQQHTRKWLLSEHMTRSEIVATCLKCVLTSEEHEAREDFLYKGQRIFGPHLDVEALLDLSQRTDVRH